MSGPYKVKPCSECGELFEFLAPNQLACCPECKRARRLEMQRLWRVNGGLAYLRRWRKANPHYRRPKRPTTKKGHETGARKAGGASCVSAW
jgi:hypothetical protein